MHMYKHKAVLHRHKGTQDRAVKRGKLYYNMNINEHEIIFQEKG